ncbi:MAG: glycerophosphodiester phosphodiesterase family protein, partial [Spirochaetales bacterium]|nr:glycerophosphodiester phosphodiesterase family protein [Spirochaetales bacterium]
MTNCRILAHRGASAYAPENTMAAFQKAADLKADGLEIDIHNTKDGRLVVIHDDTIDRTSNGSGVVADYEFDELQKFNFNKGMDKEYPETLIPLLEEVLQFIKDNDMFLNIEVKDVFLKSGGITHVGLQAAEMVRKYDVVDQIIFSSFNHLSMVEIKKNYPEMKTGLLYVENLYKPEVYAQTALADAIHPLFLGVFQDTITCCHSKGIKVNPWTVDEPVMIKKMFDIG